VVINHAARLDGSIRVGEDALPACAVACAESPASCFAALAQLVHLRRGEVAVVKSVDATTRFVPVDGLAASTEVVEGVLSALFRQQLPVLARREEEEVKQACF